MSENYKCSKCGKEESSMRLSEDYWITKNQWHRIKLGRMGYGSQMDGSDINFYICDNCLQEFILSFQNPELILNTGANYYEGSDADN